MFLKIDGIEGEAKDAKHPKEIEVLNYSTGVESKVSVAPGGRGDKGTVRVHEMHITKYVDKASAKLFQAAFRGDHFKEATLTFRKAGGQQEEFLVIRLSNVWVTSVQHPGTGAETQAQPMETVTLAFDQFEIKYKEQRADGLLGGLVMAAFDLKKNLGM